MCENAQKHTVCLFGGATPLYNDEEGKKQQIECVRKFMRITAENNWDVALSNHTAFDMGLEGISGSRNRIIKTTLDCSAVMINMNVLELYVYAETEQGKILIFFISS